LIFNYKKLDWYVLAQKSHKWHGRGTHVDEIEYMMVCKKSIIENLSKLGVISFTLTIFNFNLYV